MCKENLFALRKMFPDATLIKLATENPSVMQLRHSIPSSACILWYRISKNYTSVIWSVLAKEANWPDVTDEAEWCGKSILVKRTKEKDIEIVTQFKPFEKKKFIRSLELSRHITISSIRTIDEFGKINCELTEEGTYEELIKEINLLHVLDDELC